MILSSCKNKFYESGVKMTNEFAGKSLTQRELAILKFITEGRPNDEISKIANISTHTVKAHISSIIRKLNAKNRTNAAYIAALKHLFDKK